MSDRLLQKIGERSEVLLVSVRGLYLVYGLLTSIYTLLPLFDNVIYLLLSPEIFGRFSALFKKAKHRHAQEHNKRALDVSRNPVSLSQIRFLLDLLVFSLDKSLIMESSSSRTNDHRNSAPQDGRRRDRDPPQRTDREPGERRTERTRITTREPSGHSRVPSIDTRQKTSSSEVPKR